MLGKIEYGVKPSEELLFLNGFINNNTTDSVRISYGERSKECREAFKSFQRAIESEKVDISITEILNSLYLEKNKFVKEEIVIQESLKEFSTSIGSMLVDKNLVQETEDLAKEVVQDEEVVIPSNLEDGKIYRLRCSGHTQREIATKLGISQSRVCQVLKKYT